jgi:hypothetical protein
MMGNAVVQSRSNAMRDSAGGRKLLPLFDCEKKTTWPDDRPLVRVELQNSKLYKRAFSLALKMFILSNGSVYAPHRKDVMRWRFALPN